MAGLFEGRLSRFIRQRREDLQLTQKQVAEAIGVDPDFISLVEYGHRRLSLDRVAHLADILATDKTYLCMMALMERAPVFFQELFAEPVLADLAKGGKA